MDFKNATELAVASDLVVVGYNPENADYTNPRGAIHGVAAYVVATCPKGYRWSHQWSSTGVIERDQLARAGIMLDRMRAVLDEGGELDEQYWRPMDPAYGSEAYQIEGVEEERAYMDRFDD